MIVHVDINLDDVDRHRAALDSAARLLLARAGDNLDLYQAELDRVASELGPASAEVLTNFAYLLNALVLYGFNAIIVLEGLKRIHAQDEEIHAKLPDRNELVRMVEQQFEGL
jgi:hypothetical protein